MYIFISDEIWYKGTHHFHIRRDLVVLFSSVGHLEETELKHVCFKET
jgi:hypothetical protein